MSNKTLTIFGCGWLGKDVAIYLINKEYFVAGSTTQEQNQQELQDVGIIPFIYNSEIKSILENLVSENIVIAFPPGKNGDYSLYQNQIKDILNIVKNKSKRVILISSTSVYPKSSGVWSENSVFKPDTFQAECILNAENELLKSTIETKIVLRFAGLIDRDRNPTKWLKDGKSSLPADELVNLIHKKDCIQIIEKLISSDYKKEIFNACADEHPLRSEFYEAVTLSKSIKFGQPSGIKRIIDNSKLKQILNYEYSFKNPISFFAS